MEIPLDRFEQVIDETILKRGLTYFKKGYVAELTELATGEYEAIVHGTEEYTVHLEIKKNIVEEHYCNCPYDMGPVCKHIVAVIFYLQQDLLDLDQNGGTKTRKKRTKSVSQQVKEILKTLSHEELKEFVHENTKNDRKFRNNFLASFGHKGSPQSKEFYQKQIRSIFRTAAGRDGYIYWSDMRAVINSLDPLLRNAEKHLENKSFDNVIFICTALIEETTEAFQFGDDSGGDLGYLVSCSMELLGQLTETELPTSIRKELLEYCVLTFDDGLFSGWDWHIGILYIAEKLIEDESEADLILECLGSVEEGYQQEQAQYFELEILREYKSPEQVAEFIAEHISNYHIRNEEIGIAFNNADFDRAISLATDGVEYNSQIHPGRVSLWEEWLLKIAQAQSNAPEIINYARIMFINDRGSEQDYYQILKEHIKTKKWRPFVEEIIEEISVDSPGSWRNMDLVRRIYIKEEWWDKLYEWVVRDASFMSLAENEKHLVQDYRSELILLYDKNIRLYLEENMGRKYYQNACQYLRRMKKLGATKQVASLIEELRESYSRRPALLEELKKV